MYFCKYIDTKEILGLKYQNFVIAIIDNLFNCIFTYPIYELYEKSISNYMLYFNNFSMSLGLKVFL